MNWSVISANQALLWQGLETTALLSVAAIVGSTLLGLVSAALRTARIPVLAQLSRLYVEVFRGSPLLILLLFVYFGASYLGFSQMSTFTAAAIAISLYEGAYVAEIFRAGIEAVPRGQQEAARVLGLSGRQTFVHVVLPQTRTVALPPLVGQYLSLIKDTSLANVIGLAEMLRQGQAIVDRVGQPLTVYLTVAAVYFIICYPLSLLVRYLERTRRA